MTAYITTFIIVGILFMILSSLLIYYYIRVARPEKEQYRRISKDMSSGTWKGMWYKNRDSIVIILSIVLIIIGISFFGFAVTF